MPVTSETYTITLTVTEAMVGTWEIGCFEADGGHYDEGMYSTRVIEFLLYQLPGTYTNTHPR